MLREVACQQSLNSSEVSAFPNKKSTVEVTFDIFPFQICAVARRNSYRTVRRYAYMKKIG